jgi:hypothetical protein
MIGSLIDAKPLLNGSLNMEYSNHNGIEKLISRFKSSLTPTAHEHLSEAHWKDLDFMIREVMAEELQVTLEQMEEAIKKTRSKILDLKPGMSF